MWYNGTRFVLRCISITWEVGFMNNIILISMVVGAVIIISGLFLLYQKNNNSYLHVGDTAPDFKLLGQDNAVHELRYYTGQYIVLYFYPKDDTPGCTVQACALRDNVAMFENHNIKVFGINYDSVVSHKAFADKYQLPFTLLSDTDKKVAHAYGAASLAVIMPKRMTFIINPEQKICAILKEVDVTTHTKYVLELIEHDINK